MKATLSSSVAKDELRRRKLSHDVRVLSCHLFDVFPHRNVDSNIALINCQSGETELGNCNFIARNEGLKRITALSTRYIQKKELQKNPDVSEKTGMASKETGLVGCEARHNYVGIVTPQRAHFFSLSALVGYSAPCAHFHA